MTFSAAVRSAFANYARFSGRTSRSEFWWFFLALALASIAAMIIAVSADVLWLYYVLVLPFVLPLIAVAVRRLHDTGRSGWWYLVIVVPIANIALYVFWALPSERRENRFGPVPA
jgi:uncharacterized membrane protein YhaH (DUF805 family)